jgi:hypothetical protein
MAATTASGRSRRNRLGGHRTLTVVAALTAAVLVGACATEGDGPDLATGPDVGEFAATSEYLAGVATATDGLTYRMSMDIAMQVVAEGDSIEMGGTLMTGAVDGDVSTMTMDMAELFRDIAEQAPGDGPPAEMLDADLTMEMVTDGTTLYVRAPLINALEEFAGDMGAPQADLGPMNDLAALGDEWGRIDLSELSFSEVAGAAGAQALDPEAFLDMMSQGTDVRELGTETIDGVEVRGLGATITYGDMFEAQGMDADDVRDQMSAAGGGSGDEQFEETFGDILEGMFAMEMPIEVWVDGDDRVRRVAFEQNMTEIIEAVAEQSGEDLGEGGMSMSQVMDFSDYGDESIEIEVPADAVDITDEYRALIEGGGLGTGNGPSVGGA